MDYYSIHLVYPLVQISVTQSTQVWTRKPYRALYKFNRYGYRPIIITANAMFYEKSNDPFI